jgi:hypothetical protein
MGRVGDGKHGRARGDALLGQAVVHVGGRQQAEADVMVFGVVGSVSSIGSSNHDQTTTMKRRRTARTTP